MTLNKALDRLVENSRNAAAVSIVASSPGFLGHLFHGNNDRPLIRDAKPNECKLFDALCSGESQLKRPQVDINRADSTRYEIEQEIKQILNVVNSNSEICNLPEVHTRIAELQERYEAIQISIRFLEDRYKQNEEDEKAAKVYASEQQRREEEMRKEEEDKQLQKDIDKERQMRDVTEAYAVEKDITSQPAAESRAPSPEPMAVEEETNVSFTAEQMEIPSSECQGEVISYKQIAVEQQPIEPIGISMESSKTSQDEKEKLFPQKNDEQMVRQPETSKLPLEEVHAILRVEEQGAASTSNISELEMNFINDMERIKELMRRYENDPKQYHDTSRQLLRFALISGNKQNEDLISSLSKEARGKVLLKVLDMLLCDIDSQGIPLNQLKRELNTFAVTQGLEGAVGTEAIYMLMATKQLTIDRSGPIPLVKHNNFNI
ncbi:hypothetical protein EC973_002625 [Apophysomyces ossiformis]|uniref:Uncharacterized protein n=1 Tax=Apophysomyces ossiformis TaxID=679940 RepID=A0A8H7ELL0_9FUNG|nr:hypothetical protein EC973_002625 [Apophysomyces ossiformis]